MGWKAWIGLTKAKRDIARATGVPTTKAGRRAKFGALPTLAGSSGSSPRSEDGNAGSFSGLWYLGWLFLWPILLPVWGFRNYPRASHITLCVLTYGFWLPLWLAFDSEVRGWVFGKVKGLLGRS